MPPKQHIIFDSETDEPIDAPKTTTRKRRRRYKADVDRDGELYILSRFGKKYKRWVQADKSPDLFYDLLRRRYGSAQTKKIKAILTRNRVGLATRWGKRTIIQRRGRYPSEAGKYSLRQIMVIARRAAREKNKGHIVDVRSYTGPSCANREEYVKLKSIIKSSLKRYKSGKKKGMWYASLKAAKEASGKRHLNARKFKSKLSGEEKWTLRQYARACCKMLNERVVDGEKLERPITNARVAEMLDLPERKARYVATYLRRSIYWNPAYGKYMYTTPLVGYGEGEMISVRGVMGGSIRGYGEGGSIRGYGHKRRHKRHKHHKRRRSSSSSSSSKKRTNHRRRRRRRTCCGGSIVGKGGSIVGKGRGGSIVGKGLIKGVVGAAKKVNNFARKTKIISKGVRALGYGMDSAGYLDSAY